MFPCEIFNILFSHEDENIDRFSNLHWCFFKNKILYRFQSSFRKNYSTNTCLGHLTGKITTGFKKDVFTGRILINLQKVFDTSNHQISVINMKYLGFSKNAIACFKSYLCERKFKISISTSYSSPPSVL